LGIDYKQFALFINQEIVYNSGANLIIIGSFFLIIGAVCKQG